MSEYLHKEAFCLMTYRDENSTEEEVLWNSRDGVTPFGISSRIDKTKTLYHVDWNKDLAVENYKPIIGMRIFVNATKELIKDSLNAYMDKHCPDGFYGKNREEAYKSLEKNWLHDGKAPWIVEVTSEYGTSTNS
jgi:hypothetical protein